MEYSVEAQPMRMRHVVAIPSPGRGHVNPMMNLCKLLVARDETIHVTFVGTEECLGFIGSEPSRIVFGALPDVVPSELIRASNMDAFLEAVLTKIEAPFEQLLDGLEPTRGKPRLIIADLFLPWVVGVGKRRGVEVASFCPMPPSVFSVFHHFNLLERNGHVPPNLPERGSEVVNYIPGLSATRVADLPISSEGENSNFLKGILEITSQVNKSQYLLFPTVYELDPLVINALKAELSIPIYTIGLAIPYTNILSHHKVDPSSQQDHHYLQWLDRQPRGSVLYISLGSFLSVSASQMDEIAAGLRESGTRFLWVARQDADRVRELVSDLVGLVVPWCDQLRVLCHTSVGGFWSHCGWNSVQEGLFAGVPFLTFPIAVDQLFNSKVIVEDWKIGWRAIKRDHSNGLVGREEIAGLMRKFMGLESDDHEAKELRRRARELREICLCAIGEGGSSESNIDAFLTNIS